MNWISTAMLVSLVAGACSSALADESTARAKAELSPREGGWVGQRVTLAITLLTPDLFAGAPSFDLPSIPGTVVIPPRESPVLGSETIGETSFTTQRHEFAVYAQRAGIVRIPSIAIHFDTNSGFGQPIIERKLRTEPISFTAKTPPGAEALGIVIGPAILR